MHELGVARSIVELATDAARNAGATRVTAIRVRIGDLAGVAPESLRFCFDAASENTVITGARLEIEVIRVAIHCNICEMNLELSEPIRFVCPNCNTPIANIVHGHELEVESIEVI